MLQFLTLLTVATAAINGTISVQTYKKSNKYEKV